ncbi:MAG: enoyl-CoA hydratase/isomerase family protein [Alphaproteobacteria bacterium]|jgi:enoyl-CoA hydratase/carnithine racemase|nr:enoyl-CoA hydratase/isomerase family protein [Alphaproteobacteria bacterium]
MTSQNGLLITRVDEFQLDVQIDRPERSNSLDTPTVAALTDVVLEAYEDETRLLILSGAGKNFCSGFDTGQGGFANKKERNNRILAIESLLQLIWNAPYVSVAMVQGAAIGAGADLAVNCDYRACAASTWLRFPGFRLSGVTLGTGRLARIVGDHQAFDLVLRNRKVAVTEALELGLATHAVEDADRRKFADELAADLKDVPKNSIVALKSAVRAADRWQSVSRIPMSLRR